MEITNQLNNLTVCARCPLNKKLYNEQPEFRQGTEATVQHISEKIEELAGTFSMYGEMPEFVAEITEESGKEDLLPEAWFCSRIRRLGTCSTMRVVFPDEKYL